MFSRFRRRRELLKKIKNVHTVMIDETQVVNLVEFGYNETKNSLHQLRSTHKQIIETHV
jgi:hypothetical protein